MRAIARRWYQIAATRSTNSTNIHDRCAIIKASRRPNLWRAERPAAISGGLQVSQHTSAKLVAIIRTGGGFMPIAVGQSAPEFTLKDQNQNEVKLSDFAGKRKVVLMFYPLDFSPVCTNEHACFVNDLKQYEKLDAQVLGLSVDSVWTHKAFAEKMGINYPLLADFHPKGAVADKFGVYLAEKGITGRAIAIIDKAGKIAWFKNYDIPVLPDMKEVGQALAGVK
jgi:peroxiredoxin